RTCALLLPRLLFGRYVPPSLSQRAPFRPTRQAGKTVGGHPQTTGLRRHRMAPSPECVAAPLGRWRGGRASARPPPLLLFEAGGTSRLGMGTEREGAFDISRLDPSRRRCASAGRPPRPRGRADAMPAKEGACLGCV